MDKQSKQRLSKLRQRAQRAADESDRLAIEKAEKSGFIGVEETAKFMAKHGLVQHIEIEIKL